MTKNVLNITISDPIWETKLENVEEISQKIFDRVINQLNPECFIGKEAVFANLQLSDDKEIHVLNKEFRNIDKPTNILSFANVDDIDFENYIKRNEKIELGDMIIALETIVKESKEENLSILDHYSHILIHGILHLLGYDHIDEDDAIEMENTEIELLKSFNIENPYEER